MKIKITSLCALSFLLCVAATAQSKTVPSRQLDSVAAKVIHYFQQKQADSVYLMTGKSFQDKITSENFSSITTTKIFPLNDFSKVTYVSNDGGVSKYKVGGTPDLQLLIGLDADDKIETLLVQQYSGD